MFVTTNQLGSFPKNLHKLIDNLFEGLRTVKWFLQNQKPTYCPEEITPMAVLTRPLDGHSPRGQGDSMNQFSIIVVIILTLFVWGCNSDSTVPTLESAPYTPATGGNAGTGGRYSTGGNSTGGTTSTGGAATDPENRPGKPPGTQSYGFGSRSPSNRTGAPPLARRALSLHQKI